MEALAYIYVLGVGLVTALALFGHFGFNFGTGPLSHKLGFDDVRFVVFTLLWFVALSVWLFSCLVGRRHD